MNSSCSALNGRASFLCFSTVNTKVLINLVVIIKVRVRGLFDVSSQLFVLFVQQAQNAFLSPFIMSAGMDHDGSVVMFIKRDSGIKGAVVGRRTFF